MSGPVVQRTEVCVKPERGRVQAACFVSASARVCCVRLRGDVARARFSAVEPAVQAFRAREGCGGQNGKWLLMARINLFGPGE